MFHTNVDTRPCVVLQNDESLIVTHVLYLKVEKVQPEFFIWFGSCHKKYFILGRLLMSNVKLFSDINKLG